MLKVSVWNKIVLLDLLGPSRDQGDLRTFVTNLVLS